MSYIPTSDSMNTVVGQVESQMQESSVRRHSKSYQIFPENKTDEDSDSCSYPDDFLYRRERLPSIVVEPTEHSEIEREVQCCPHHCQISNSCRDEEDSSADSAETVDGDNQGTDKRSDERKSSIGPSQSLLSLSRLTPPASPTKVEAAPPCPKN